MTTVHKMLFIIAILFQFVVQSQQWDCYYNESYNENAIFIQSGDVGLTLYKTISSFQIYVMQNGSYAIYNKSLESKCSLTFDDDFKINGQNLTVVELEGNIVLPTFLEMFFATHELYPAVIEPIELCFDFSAERLSLKISTGLLALMLILTNLKDIQKIYTMMMKQQSPSMVESTFSDNFISWRGLSNIPESAV